MSASSKLDRATRASPEPASGLGHSASVPSAIEAAYKEGWMVNAIPPDEHPAGPDYVHGCCDVDWQASQARAASAIEARSDATGTGAAEGESAAPNGGDAQ